MSVSTRRSASRSGGLVEFVVAWVAGMVDAFKQEVALTLSHIQQFGLEGGLERLVERWQPDFSNSGARARAHQSSQVVTGLIIVITVSVAVVIVSSFNSSLGGIENDALSNAQQSVLQGFADMVGLIAPLLLIIIAVVIVAYVQKMRSG